MRDGRDLDVCDCLVTGRVTPPQREGRLGACQGLSTLLARGKSRCLLVCALEMCLCVKEEQFLAVHSFPRGFQGGEEGEAEGVVASLAPADNHTRGTQK